MALRERLTNAQSQVEATSSVENVGGARLAMGKLAENEQLKLGQLVQQCLGRPIRKGALCSISSVAPEYPEDCTSFLALGSAGSIQVWM
jgi:hypothetical protein